MGVPRGSLRLGVSQELTHNRQRHSAANQMRCEAMAQIVDANPGQLGGFGYFGPWPFQVRESVRPYCQKIHTHHREAMTQVAPAFGRSRLDAKGTLGLLQGAPVLGSCQLSGHLRDITSLGY
jgi:hypothetical protein